MMAIAARLGRAYSGSARISAATVFQLKGRFWCSAQALALLPGFLCLKAHWGESAGR